MRVRSEPLTWTSDEQHQFYVINLEGASPTFDVLMLDVIWVPEFAQAGWLLDLSAWVTREELAPHFPAAVGRRHLGRARLGAALEHERRPPLLPRAICWRSTA